jgi:exonuclease V gamma subunit
LKTAQSEALFQPNTTLMDALQRLWLGYIAGTDIPSSAYSQASIGLDVSARSALETLSALAQALQSYCAACAKPRTFLAWCNVFPNALEQLCQYSEIAKLENSSTAHAREQNAEQAFFARFDDAISALRLRVQRLDDLLHEPLPFSVFYAELKLLMEQSDSERERLAPELQRGGLVCCGMVPMRLLPYRVVCIIGMSRAEFPHNTTLDSSNWMRKPGQARIGDRNTRDEDHYLFLEALLAAREQLILSYAHDSSDQAQSSASDALVRLQTYLDQSSAATDPPYCLSAASYLPRLTAAPHHISTPAQNRSSTLVQAETIKQVRLSELQSFWRNPVRHFFQRRLLARQPEPATIDRQLTIGAPRENFLEYRALQIALRHSHAYAQQWLAHSALPGRDVLADMQRSTVRKNFKPVWEALLGIEGEQQLATLRCARVNLQCALESGREVTLHGVIDNICAARPHLLQINARGAGPVDWIALKLKLALLQLCSPEQIWSAQLVAPVKGLPDQVLQLDAKQARIILQQALSPLLQADNAPLWFFPKLGFERRQQYQAAAASKQTVPAVDEDTLARLAAWDQPDVAKLREIYGVDAEALFAPSLDGEHAPAAFAHMQQWSDFWFSDLAR